MQLLKQVLLLLCAVMAAAGAAAADGTPGGSSAEPAKQIKRKPMELRTDRARYLPGRPVRLVLAVTNTTSEPVRYNFSSGKQFDFWVTRRGREVWRWSRGRFFTMALTSITLKPGESKTFTATWDQRDTSRSQVRPGSYLAQGELAVTGPRPVPATKAFAIGAGRTGQVTVSAVVSNPQDYVGKTVTLSGTYCGWRKPLGVTGCEFGPPVTRSDWILSDGESCIYVTGPSGLSQVKDRGKSITVQAEVMRSPKGLVYLRAAQTR